VNTPDFSATHHDAEKTKAECKNRRHFMANYTLQQVCNESPKFHYLATYVWGVCINENPGNSFGWHQTLVLFSIFAWNAF
jgi:hypothetical protein